MYNEMDFQNAQNAENGSCSTHEHKIGQQRASYAVEVPTLRLEDEPVGIGGALLLSADKAALLLGISRAHFYCMHSCGRLGPLPVHLGRRTLWNRQELVEWCNSGCVSRREWIVMRKGKA
jgi:predicted DNA-binding transcriptional regulator AlpA